MKAEDVQINAVWSILSKGRSGSGKTIASCGKEFRPCYVFDFDQRMTSVINYYRKLDGHCKDLEFDSYHMGMSFHQVDRKMDEFIKLCPYKTVVIATLSSYIDLVLVHILGMKAGQQRNSGKEAGKSIGGIQVNELEDYNAEDAAIIFELCGFLKTLQKQGVNVILEAHITPIEIRDISGKIVQTIMEIQTKGRKPTARLPGYFDETWLFDRQLEGMIVGQQSQKFQFLPEGNSVTEGKTSRSLKGFDWTNRDFSVELMKQVSDEVRQAPRVDPNAPKKVSF